MTMASGERNALDPGNACDCLFIGGVVNVTVVKVIAALTLALTLGLFIAPLAGEVQQAGTVSRIGYLAIASSPPIRHLFEQALRERGWVIGENLVITYRNAEGKYDRLPIGEGLIASLARSGGNVTGLTGAPSPETSAKHLQLLKEAVPRAQRISFLRNPANPTTLPTVKTVTEAARTLGLELQVVGARAPEEFEAAFRAVAQARADALLIYGDAARSSLISAGSPISRSGTACPPCPSLMRTRRLAASWPIR